LYGNAYLSIELFIFLLDVPVLSSLESRIKTVEQNVPLFAFGFLLDQLLVFDICLTVLNLTLKRFIIKVTMENVNFMLRRNFAFTILCGLLKHLLKSLGL